MSTHSIRERIFSVVVVGVLSLATPFASAANLYGGPQYDASTSTGYTVAYLYEPWVPWSPFGGNGVAAVSVRRYESGMNKGKRVLRWNASDMSAIELGTLGTDDSGVTQNENSFSPFINTAGTVVGRAQKFVSGVNKGYRAVKWNVTSTNATELGNLGTDSDGETDSQATSINEAGTVVGRAHKYVSGTSKGHRAVRWDALGNATELGVLGAAANGFTDVSGISINAGGVAVGQARAYESGIYKGDRAVRWNASGAAAELGILAIHIGNADAVYLANSINSEGTAIGTGMEPFATNPDFRAIRWDASATIATELGNLGVSVNGTLDSRPNAINDSGTVVGRVTRFESGISRGYRAVRWDALSAVANELGHLGTDASGSTHNYAIDINGPGISVGSVEKYDPSGTLLGPRAVAWHLDGTVVDLNTLLPASEAVNWELTEAIDISDSFWITGTGKFDPDGPGPLAPYGRHFLLDIISEFGVPGDANRDGLVNFNDLLIVAQNYGDSSGATWDTGDFNGDNGVNFADLLTLSQHYGQPGITLAEALDHDFAVDWMIAQSFVPEPGTLMSTVLPTLLLRRCRRVQPAR